MMNKLNAWNQVKNILYHCTACLNKSWQQQMQERYANIELCFEVVKEVHNVINKLLENTVYNAQKDVSKEINNTRYVKKLEIVFAYLADSLTIGNSIHNYSTRACKHGNFFLSLFPSYKF